MGKQIREKTKDKRRARRTGEGKGEDVFEYELDTLPALAKCAAKIKEKEILKIKIAKEVYQSEPM